MSEADFSEALGRLLTDGPLRDAFAHDPAGVAASLSGDETVQAELRVLRIEDLEYQAGVLLRKRFDALKRLLPELFARMGEEAWPLFESYGRVRWLQGYEDALAFAEEMRERMTSREMNRLRFSFSDKRWRMHGIQLGPFRPAMQVLFRRSNGTWREVVLYFRF